MTSNYTFFTKWDYYGIFIVGVIFIAVGRITDDILWIIFGCMAIIISIVSKGVYHLLNEIDEIKLKIEVINKKLNNNVGKKKEGINEVVKAEEEK